MKSTSLCWLDCLEKDLFPANLVQLSCSALIELKSGEYLQRRARIFRQKVITQINVSPKRAIANMTQLISKSDIVYTYFVEYRAAWSASSKSDVIVDIYRHTLAMMQNLLDDLVHIARRNDRIKFAQLHLTKYECSSVVKLLQMKLFELKRTVDVTCSDLALIGMVSAEVKSLLFSSSITYSAYWYLQHFLNALERYKPSTSAEIILFLCERDFNAPVFFKLLRTIFHQAIERQIDLRAQLEIVYMLEDTVKGACIHSGMQAPFAGISLLKQLLSYLASKQTTIQKRIELLGKQPHDGPGRVATDWRLQVNFSVPLFGYFIRLLIAVGIFGEHDKVTIFQFFAQHFRTPDTVSISPGSLQRKSRNVEQSSVRSMRKTLKNLEELNNRSLW